VDNALLYEQAQRASRAREDLLAIVSHDLRNPLSVVLTSAELLQHSAGTDAASLEKIRKYSQTIARAAGHMERLLKDLMDFAQIQAARLTVDRKPVDAGGLIQESLELLKPLAVQKGLHLNAHFSENLVLDCDRDRVLQILSNLVGNAIKFTPQGGSVSIHAERAGDEACFSIADTGPGIPEQELSNIWERYWQAEKKKASGIGLGLTIAKGLIEAHGTRMWAESKVGSGTTFYFTLPISSGEPQRDTKPMRPGQHTPVV
jgi:signal transduction histidine kinase